MSLLKENCLSISHIRRETYKSVLSVDASILRGISMVYQYTSTLNAGRFADAIFRTRKPTRHPHELNPDFKNSFILGELALILYPLGFRFAPSPPPLAVAG